LNHLFDPLHQARQEGVKTMADSEQKTSTEGKGFLASAFKAGLSAAEDIQARAIDIPLNILEGMGAPEDKMTALRDKSRSLTHDLYSTINSVASQLGLVDQGSEAEKKD